MHGDPRILRLESICLCLKCTKTYFKFREIEYTGVTEVSLSKAIFHTNTYKLMSSEGIVKGHVFQKQA